MTTTNKFAAFTNKFEEFRKKLEEQKKQQEEGKKPSYDYSWKFEPKLPEDKSKITFRVRILPNVHNPDAVYPWISGPFHMYRKPDGKFLYTLCPSINDNKEKGVKNPCPICEKASALFKTLDKKDEDLAHKMYKKPRHFVNVLVIEDPRPGEQNQAGKVLVMEYGKKLQEKFQDTLIDQKIDIVDPLVGHDLNLIIKRQGEHTNYDSSSFSIEKTPIAETTEEMNKIFDAIHNMHEKIFARGPQSYDKLVDIMNSVPSAKSGAAQKAATKQEVDTTESVELDVPAPTPKVAPKVAPKVEPVKSSAPKAKEDDIDIEDFNFDE